MDYKNKSIKNSGKQADVTYSVQIPIGKASIKQMIDAGFYADKTPYINKLFKDDGTYFFFIRPRRFGKSLLLDTIDQIAKGNKALFTGCAIYEDPTYKWKKYPVIWLNFSELVSKESDLLDEELQYKLLEIAANHGIHKLKAPSLSTKLAELVNTLRKLQEGYEPTPIILIDEYDSPLISCKEDQYEGVLSVLSSFFKVLKARQKDCKFIFVTGVTKFHLSGLTSGANSANDISLHEDYAEMLGYTEEDIDNLFLSKEKIINPVLEKLNRKKRQEEKYTLIQLKQALKDYYNGYCFTDDKIISVYNPDSILKFFRDKSFGNYWSNSGNPTILLQQIKNNIGRFNIDWDKDDFIMSQESFEYVASTLHTIPLLPLMYQTGYLTLDPDGFTNDCRMDKNETDYYLKFPNGEVKSALKLVLADFIAQKQEEAGRVYRDSILDYLRTDNWLAFFNCLRSGCLAKAGYRFLDKSERSFQGALYSFLNGAFHTSDGTWASAERDSGIGRTDIIMEDQYNGNRTIYIFELKVDKPALEALEQIRHKDYSLQYDLCHKKVLIGLKCDAAKLNITEAVIEIHQRDEWHTFQVMSRKNFNVNAAGYFQEAGV
ncbi:AAA family ATPase [Cardinium endosymbiont of Philonthus spinipes]|uniref:AAA family ATPase n=1 Tax=Cardinium endosymbiont of Philonthus spinipes TaxID=3077941 RepID=UPI00313BCECB